LVPALAALGLPFIVTADPISGKVVGITVFTLAHYGGL
jgi:hypothetical protein